MKEHLYTSLAGAFVLVLMTGTPLAAQETADQMPPVVLGANAGNASPLNAFSVTPSATLCTQGRLALADGKLGYVVPMVGPTVMRGSLEMQTPVTWRVVTLDHLDRAARDALSNTYAVCTQAR